MKLGLMSAAFPKMSLGQLDVHGVVVAVEGGGGVGVGHAPEPEMMTAPPVTEPIGAACAAGEITTTSESVSGVSPPPQPWSMMCASAPLPEGPCWAAPVLYVKHPYETAPVETIGALHCTVRPVLPRRSPGCASMNDTRSAS